MHLDPALGVKLNASFVHWLDCRLMFALDSTCSVLLAVVPLFPVRTKLALTSTLLPLLTRAIMNPS